MNTSIIHIRLWRSTASIILLVIFIGGLAALIPAHSLEQQDYVSVVNASKNINRLGYATIYGEIANEGDKYLTDIEIDTRLMEDSRIDPFLVKTINVTGSKDTAQEDNSLVLPPGSKVGFKFTLEDKVLSKRISTYDFVTRYKIANEKPKTMLITDSHVYPAASGNGVTNWVIIGELKNGDESDDIWDTHLIISIHDISDNTVGVTEIDGPFTNENRMKAGQSWAYFTNVQLPSDIDVRSISVFAESRQSVIQTPSAPLITSPSNGSITDNFLTIMGTAEASSNIRVYDEIAPTPIASATANETGIWITSTRTALSSGGHSLIAKATDLAGNTSPNSARVTFTVHELPSDFPMATIIIAVIALSFASVLVLVLRHHFAKHKNRADIEKRR